MATLLLFWFVVCCSCLNLRPYFGLLLSRVSAPHHFLVQGVKKGIALFLDHADGVLCLAQGEGSAFGVALADAVDGHKKASTSTFYVEVDGLVVCNDDRAYS